MVAPTGYDVHTPLRRPGRLNTAEPRAALTLRSRMAVEGAGGDARAPARGLGGIFTNGAATATKGTQLQDMEERQGVFLRMIWFAAASIARVVYHSEYLLFLGRSNDAIIRATTGWCHSNCPSFKFLSCSVSLASFPFLLP